MRQLSDKGPDTETDTDPDPDADPDPEQKPCHSRRLSWNKNKARRSQTDRQRIKMERMAGKEECKRLRMQLKSAQVGRS